MQKLKENIGGLISINSFLSSTTDIDVAIVYAGDSNAHHQLASVLFQIIIDLNTVNADDERSFANIQEHSYFKSEDEILFSMSTIFRIESIEMMPNSHVWKVKRAFVTEDNIHMKELDDYFNRPSGQNTTEGDLGKLLLLMGDYDRAIAYCKLLLAESHDSSLSNVYQILGCYSTIGEAYSSKECYELGLQYYEANLELLLEYDPSNCSLLSRAYNNIGSVHSRMKSSCSLVLEYYEKSLQLELQSSRPDYYLIATVLHNMAPLMDAVDESIQTYLKAIEIGEAHLPVAHPLIATTYHCLGSFYSMKSDMAAALKCFERAIDLREKYLPVDHPLHVDAYEDISTLYFQLGHEEKIFHSNDQLAKDNYTLALKYDMKALNMLLDHSPEKNRKEISNLYSNIGVVYIYLEAYDIAFEYLEKSRENQSSPNYAIWHNNMGKLYTKRGDFKSGLTHYKQALILYQENFATDHPLFARLYYNLGELYEMQDDCTSALINYEKALEIGLLQSQTTDTCIVQYKNAVQKLKNNSATATGN